MGISKEVAFKDILKDLREENLAIFAGAGMSIDSGYVSWPDLLRPIAEELGLDRQHFSGQFVKRLFVTGLPATV